MLIPCTVLASPPSSTYGFHFLWQTALELKHLLVKHSPASSISDDGRETVATASSQSTVIISPPPKTISHSLSRPEEWWAGKGWNEYFKVELSTPESHPCIFLQRSHSERIAQLQWCWKLAGPLVDRIPEAIQQLRLTFGYLNHKVYKPKVMGICTYHVSLF